MASNNTENSTPDASVLPHLESWERMMKLPVVEAAWSQSQGYYDKVKDFNPMFNWAFRTTENVVKSAVTMSAPIVNRFDAPIGFVDQTFIKGLDKLEASAPIIKEQPGEIYNQAKAKVLDVVQPQINKVCAMRKTGEQRAASLKELSYNKAKEVLATSYGSMAVTGIDSTAVLAERLLDSFFPKTAEDDAEDAKKPISAEEDPVLHTVQTIGRLNNQVARRVYRTVSHQITQIKKQDLTEYVASLIAVLRLTQYLNFLNERVQQRAQHAEKNGDCVKGVANGATM